jgi:hypothetical protein
MTLVVEREEVLVGWGELGRWVVLWPGLAWSTSWRPTPTRPAVALPGRACGSETGVGRRPVSEQLRAGVQTVICLDIIRCNSNEYRRTWYSMVGFDPRGAPNPAGLEARLAAGVTRYVQNNFHYTCTRLWCSQLLLTPFATPFATPTVPTRSVPNGVGGLRTDAKVCGIRGQALGKEVM